MIVSTSSMALSQRLVGAASELPCPLGQTRIMLSMGLPPEMAEGPSIGMPAVDRGSNAKTSWGATGRASVSSTCVQAGGEGPRLGILRRMATAPKMCLESIPTSRQGNHWGAQVLVIKDGDAGNTSLAYGEVVAAEGETQSKVLLSSICDLHELTTLPPPTQGRSLSPRIANPLPNSGMCRLPFCCEDTRYVQRN